jgi:hypothetical protein
MNKLPRNGQNRMEIRNAFISKKAPPTPDELASTLGTAAPIWNQLSATLAADQGIIDQEWKSSSSKYGWSLLLKLRKRTIVYLGPSAGCFRASFVLGSRAVIAARQGDLPRHVLQLLDEAPHYPEGTGLRFAVRSVRDLPAIRKHVAIKLAN